MEALPDDRRRENRRHHHHRRVGAALAIRHYVAGVCHVDWLVGHRWVFVGLWRVDVACGCEGKMKKWFLQLISGKPHFIIGGVDDPYMLRWYLIPRNHFLNVYLHKFLRDDEDRALHDHPWWFVSVMLRGCYTEIIAHDDDGNGRGFVRSALSVAFRRATHRHRVVLARDANQKPVPCWTLVITGRKRRVWGFWCQQGFVKWTDFVAPSDHGAVGKGCDQ